MATDIFAKPPTLTAANRVTILRILGIPFFALCTIYYLDSVRQGVPNETLRIGALTLFAAIALTDALDGYLARSRGEITRLGKMLDPLADKALLITATLLLTRPSLPQFRPQLPVYLTAAMISRDALLLSGAAIIHQLTGAVEVRPRPVGKISTFLVMLAILWVLMAGPDRPFRWICAAATFFTVAAGLRYLADGIHQLERGGGATAAPTPAPPPSLPPSGHPPSSGS
jgi:CDP-diacylglycerol--glycerol-3-phosphate 3-phosphatidyltransferase